MSLLHVLVAPLVVACADSQLTGRPTQHAPAPYYSTEESRDGHAKIVASSVALYCRQLLEDPELEPIRGKLALSLNAEDVTFTMLASVETPTDVERSTMILLVEHRVACLRRESNDLIPIWGPPPLWVLHHRQRNTAVLASLYGKAITYGEFNKALQENKAIADKEAADEQYRAEMLRAEYAQLNAAQSQARAAQMQADAQERMRLDQQYREAAANLANLGKVLHPTPPRQIDCTSQAMGSVITTTCK